MRKLHKHGCHPYFKLRRNEMNVPNLCKIYNWPSALAGGGIIAIVELGGGWVQSDMDAFFESIAHPNPQITDVSVDGTQNSPNQHLGDPQDPDYEVAMDIQIAGAAYYLATGTPAVIRVYWSNDISTAVQAATKDGCDVCSISWGSDEANWGLTNAEQMESTAEAATIAGMVVFAASGDNDSSDGGTNAANVDVPSSCPHVVGCGGTSKTPDTETVWNNSPPDNRIGRPMVPAAVYPVRRRQETGPHDSVGTSNRAAIHSPYRQR